MRGTFGYSLLFAAAPVEGRAVYQMNKSRDTSHRVLAMGMIRITKSHYSLNSIIRSPMTSEFWTELRRGPNYRVKTVLVIEL
jgi:hypothetical protein